MTTYFTEKDGEVIAINHNESGYTITKFDISQIDDLNESFENTPQEIKAAITCSMFDCWHNFSKLLKEAS